MLILIDESGDAGFKVAKGSTPHFVVAMVVFRDLREAEAASRQDVRKDAGRWREMLAGKLDEVWEFEG